MWQRHVSRLGRWLINRHQNCSSFPPAQVITVTCRHAKHRCLYGESGRSYFVLLYQAFPALRLPACIALICCHLLSSFIPPTHTWSQMAHNLPTTARGHLKRPKLSRQAGRDWEGNTQGKGDKWLGTGQTRSAGGIRRLVEGEEDEGLCDALLHMKHWYILRSFYFKLPVLAAFLSVLPHAYSLAFKQK